MIRPTAMEIASRRCFLYTFSSIDWSSDTFGDTFSSINWSSDNFGDTFCANPPSKNRFRNIQKIIAQLVPQVRGPPHARLLPPATKTVWKNLDFKCEATLPESADGRNPTHRDRRTTRELHAPLPSSPRLLPSPRPYWFQSIPSDRKKFIPNLMDSTEFRRATVLGSDLESRGRPPARCRECSPALQPQPDSHCAPKVNQSESTSTALLHKVALTHRSMY